MEKLIAGITSIIGETGKFTELSIHSEYVAFKRQDPAKPENLDAYECRQGVWKGPIPVKIIGGGKIENSLFSFKDLNLFAITDLAKEAEAKAAELKLENPKLSGTFIKLNYSGAVQMDVFISSDRKSGTLAADQTGKVTKPFRTY